MGKMENAFGWGVATFLFLCVLAVVAVFRAACWLFER